MKLSAVSLKQIGIWTGGFERQPASKVQEAGAELEKLGYGAIWFSEGLGREAFTQAGLLLAGTSRILVATGIANIYGRDPFPPNTQPRRDICWDWALYCVPSKLLS